MQLSEESALQQQEGHSSAEDARASSEGQTRPAEAAHWAAARRVWRLALALILVYTATLSIFPGVLAEDVTSPLLGDWCGLPFMITKHVSWRPSRGCHITSAGRLLRRNCLLISHAPLTGVWLTQACRRFPVLLFALFNLADLAGKSLPMWGGALVTTRHDTILQLAVARLGFVPAFAAASALGAGPWLVSILSVLLGKQPKIL